MKIKATSKWFAFALIALVLVALMPMAVRPVTAANPAATDWIPDERVSTDLVQDEMYASTTTGKNDELYVAYEHYNPTTTYWEIKVAKSTDGGTSWSVIHTKSVGFHLFRPAIAVDPFYNYIYVVYVRQYSSSDLDIFLERYVGGVWSTVSVDNSGGTFDHFPSIVVEYDWGATNWVFIVYERHVSSSDIDLRFAKSTDHGATWTLSTLLDTTDIVHQASIAYRDGGHIYVAYTHGLTGDIDLRISHNEGGSWTTKTNIDGVANLCWGPSVAAARGLGIVVVAYVYYKVPDDDIHYNFSLDNGATWSTSNNIASTTANEGYPHLTVDGMGKTYNYAGYFHATYLKEETVGSRTNGVYYSKLNIGDLYIWSTPKQIANDNAKVKWDYWPNLPTRAITTVRDTVPVVVWTDFRGGDTDVYATTLGGKYTIDTSPSGLQVRVDGVDYWAPESFWWAYGSTHTLYAPSPQGTHSFVSWSDGGVQSHTMTAHTYGEELIVAYYTPTLTLITSPFSVPRGGNLTISGKLTPALAGQPIRLYYRMHGTIPWTLATTFTTTSTGSYGATVTVPMTAPTGYVDLVAVWYDSVNNRYAVSDIRLLLIT